MVHIPYDEQIDKRTDAITHDVVSPIADPHTDLNTDSAIIEAIWDDAATPEWWNIDSRRYGVRIGDVRILLPNGLESEVLDNSKLTLLPRTPPGLLGVLNVRGSLVPLFDLSLVTGWPSQELRQRPASSVDVMIGKGQSVFALRVNGLPEAYSRLTRSETFDFSALFGRHLIACWKTENDLYLVDFALQDFLSEHAYNYSETKDMPFHSTTISSQEEF